MVMGLLKGGIKFVVVLQLILLSGLLLAAEVEVKGPADDFTLKSHSSENHRLQEQRGRVVMLNFWASWCGPCRQEMPLLEKLHKKYGRLGFTLWGVNVDESSQDAKEMLQDIIVNFPILFDSENKVAESYQVDAMPSSVLIDRNGNKRFFFRGYKPGDEKKYETYIKQLVKER